MRRKFAAILLGGALLVGAVGFTGTAEAQTGLNPDQTAKVTQFLNGLLAKANQFCAQNPSVSLCKKVPSITQAQIDGLVSRVNSAVIRAGGVEAIKARLASAGGTVKAQLCANSSKVLAKVPAKYRTQAQSAVTRLCAS
jgi:hypothetical protein